MHTHDLDNSIDVGGPPHDLLSDSLEDQSELTTENQTEQLEESHASNDAGPPASWLFEGMSDDSGADSEEEPTEKNESQDTLGILSGGAAPAWSDLELPMEELDAENDHSNEGNDTEHMTGEEHSHENC